MHLQLILLQALQWKVAVRCLFLEIFIFPDIARDQFKSLQELQSCDLKQRYFSVSDMTSLQTQKLAFLSRFHAVLQMWHILRTGKKKKLCLQLKKKTKTIPGFMSYLFFFPDGETEDVKAYTHRVSLNRKVIKSKPRRIKTHTLPFPR